MVSSGAGTRDEVDHILGSHAPLVGDLTEVRLVHVGPERAAAQVNFQIFHLSTFRVLVVEIFPPRLSHLIILFFTSSPHQRVDFFERHGHLRDGTTAIVKAVLAERRSEFLTVIYGLENESTGQVFVDGRFDTRRTGLSIPKIDLLAVFTDFIRSLKHCVLRTVIFDAAAVGVDLNPTLPGLSVHEGCPSPDVNCEPEHLASTKAVVLRDSRFQVVLVVRVVDVVLVGPVDSRVPCPDVYLFRVFIHVSHFSQSRVFLVIACS